MQLVTGVCPLLHVGVVTTPPASHVSAPVPPSPQVLTTHSQAPELGHVESAQQTASDWTDALQASTSVSPETSCIEETSHSQPAATSMQWTLTASWVLSQAPRRMARPANPGKEEAHRDEGFTGIGGSWRIRQPVFGAEARGPPAISMT